MSRMSTITLADTRVRAASSVLEAKLTADWSELTIDTAALDALAVQQARINAEIAPRVAGMQDGAATSAALDRITSEIAGLLAAGEELRLKRARAAARRAGDERRWRDWLDLD